MGNGDSVNVQYGFWLQKRGHADTLYSYIRTLYSLVSQWRCPVHQFMSWTLYYYSPLQLIDEWSGKFTQ